MPTTLDIRHIIDRMEALEQPDRAVDALIGAAMGIGPWSLEEMQQQLAQASKQRLPEPWFGAYPRYTASIDAALTLLPWWAGWSITCGNKGSPTETPLAWVGRNGRRGIMAERRGSPATALCIAALRARLAEIEGEDV